MTGLIERLRQADPFVNDPVSLKPRLRNPDGPEAADQLAAKDTEIARLREALAFYADRDGDGYQVDVTNYGLSTEEGEIVRDGGKRARTALQSIIDVEASLDSGRGQTFSPEPGGE